MSVDIKHSLRAPFFTDSDESLVKIYLVATGLALVVFAIHPVFIALGTVGVFLLCVIHAIHVIITVLTQSLQFGYIITTIRNELAGKKALMPAWQNNYTIFFMEGMAFQFMVILFVILNVIIAIVSFGITALILPGFFQTFANGFEAVDDYTTPTLKILLCVILWALPFITALFSLYILPMACIRYAETGSIISCFNLWAITKKIFRRFVDYTFVYCMFLLSLLPVIVVCILLCFTIAGIIASSIIPFIYMIIFFNLFAQTYKSIDNITGFVESEMS